MVKDGFEYGEARVRTFTETYGLLEKITVIEPADNACSEARVTKRIRRRPGASPLLFGRFLMSLGAFISLEDISEALPPYREEVVSVEMDAPLKQAYKKLEEDVKTALKEHRGNQSVMSVALNALLLYPDRPFRLGNLYGWEYDPETQRREQFLIAETLDLDERLVYAKECRLLEEVKRSSLRGRRCQIYAVYTQKRDATRRLQHILSNEGIRVAVLTTEVPPESREGWYDRQLRGGVLRQASRRSWRIGQRRPVKVKFLHYAETMQESCLRLMGKKLLVSLAMEGKFSSEGLQSINDEDDILMATAHELVTEKGIGEKADEVWSALQKQQVAIMDGRVAGDVEMEPEPTVLPGPPIESVLAQLDQSSQARSDMDGKNPRKSGSVIPHEQLVLFCRFRQSLGPQRSDKSSNKTINEEATYSM